MLTASRRLAHSIRADYAVAAQAEGLRVWRTPRVLPWGAWLRQQWLEHRDASEASRHLRLLTTAQSQILWDEVVGRSAVAAELLNPSNAARVASRSWQRLHDYLIPVEALRVADSAEAVALFHWAESFRTRCGELHAFDETRLAQWAWDCQLMPAEPIAFAGFDAFTPAIHRLATAWRERKLNVERLFSPDIQRYCDCRDGCPG